MQACVRPDLTGATDTEWEDRHWNCITLDDEMCSEFSDGNCFLRNVLTEKLTTYLGFMLTSGKLVVKTDIAASANKTCYSAPVLLLAISLDWVFLSAFAPHLKAVRILLEHGAGPNQRYHSEGPHERTLWESYLEIFSKRHLFLRRV